MADGHTEIHFPGFTPGTWAIDLDWSGVSFELRYAHTDPIEGYFQRFDGTMFIDSNPACSTVLLGLEAVSLTTGNAERNRYLRSSAFLDVDLYPSIILRSTNMRHTDGRVVLDSSLTIRKVTQPQTLHVEELHSSSLESKDTDRVGFTATTTIQCRAFGLPKESAGEWSGVIAPDEIAFRFALAAAMGSESRASKSERVEHEGATNSSQEPLE